MFSLYHGSNNLWYGRFSVFPEDKVIHAISTRFNGTSAVPFDGLNLALHVDDNLEDVVANRKLFCEGLGLDLAKMTTCQQVHGNNVVCVTDENSGAGSISLDDTIADTDALITNLPNVALTLFFADCTPIMLYDPVHNVVGAAHGGWRGTEGEISLHTLELMQEKFATNPADCVASIGPNIGVCCYEIGEEVADKFKRLYGKDSDLILKWDKTAQKYHLNLQKANALTLQKAGLKMQNIDMADVCTACNSKIFFSYRADSGKTGRIACTIALKK